ncbi:cadherin EGF LAG seven-pass G-type receptor 2-like, partial [Denticeps clupeoides]|uniref:cadherin EGF LAG seven-pass G-type receptor 2-like n=1 Tax=Denticeps clupeoides TaxID=299321 RepID=UPI0010A2B98B
MFPLLLFGCFKLLSTSAGYNVHVGPDAGPRRVVPAAGRRGAACRLDEVIAPEFTRAWLETDAPAGTVTVSRSPDCDLLPSNPFPVYAVEEWRRPGRHAPAAQPVRRARARPGVRAAARGEVGRDEPAGRSPGGEVGPGRDEPAGRWRSPGRVSPGRQRAVRGARPAARRRALSRDAGRPLAVPLFRRDDGASTQVCLRRDKLLEVDVLCVGSSEGVGHVVSIHWRLGLGSSRRGSLENLLERVALSGSGMMSRRKRSVNTSPQFLPPTYQGGGLGRGRRGAAGLLYRGLFDSRSNNLFTVDSASGVVSTVEVLDRETKDTHVFRVTAVDRGTPPRTAMATLTITVSDTNDHDPVFEQQDYKESVRENLEIGYEVLTVRATDGDAPVNGNILYRVINSNGTNDVFEIDSRSGVIRTKGPVDREAVEAYTLLVEANDQVVVEDDNDNAPQFSEKRYVVQVPEDKAPNSQILQVTATDRDKGANALVHFSIMSGNSRGQFYIDAQTGKMDLVGQLDYEASKEYTLRIRAQDGGRPPLSNISGLVTVQVLDVNDNAPIFVSTPFQANVLENVPVGYSIIHIQAVDADSGDNSRLEYRLVETPPSFPFTINNSTGWIIVAAELDRESVDFYNFGVEARDHGIPLMSSSASISMTILDVNDNNPEFTQKAYFMRLNEDAAVGNSVVTVSAVDQDINSVVTYQISSGNTRNRFSITSQSGGGLITLALPLDYKLERQFVLSVTASDGTRFDTAKVYVNVTDANTHRPVFQSSHYTVNVNEDRPVATTVVVIS